MPDYHLSDTQYASLPLSADLQLGIQEAGYKFCTPIQALALPIALTGKDVSGQAQTGTGKTAAFLIATFEALTKKDLKKSEQSVKESSEQEKVEEDSEDKDSVEENSEQKKKEPPKKSKPAKTVIRSLMIAPTRELAKQIFDDAKPLNKKLGYKISLAYGGTDYEKQRTSIEKGCDILIGTPGRIIDYFKQGVFSLNELEVLVMDEADRMFDMGFIADIRYLLRAMPEPKQRQSLLFSATMSERVKELAYEHMNSPETIVVESEQVTADKVEQTAYMPANEDKIPLTLGLLRENSDAKAIIFINTKHQGEKIQAWLEINEFQSGLLSGDVPQKKRERLLKEFKEGKITTLVATDVAARGLHIDAVDTVINFDLPNDAEDYVHRIGRTARAGASGKAISLVCETYGMNIMDIESYIDSKIPIHKAYSDKLVADLKKPAPQPRRAKSGNSKPDRKTSDRKAPARKTPGRKTKNQDKQASNKSENQTAQATQPPQSTESTDQVPVTKNRQRYMRRTKMTKDVPLIG